MVEGLEPRTKAPKDGELNTTSKKEKARIKKRKEAKKEAAKAKVKVRHRDTKNIGKRRKPAAEATKNS